MSITFHNTAHEPCRVDGMAVRGILGKLYWENCSFLGGVKGYPLLLLPVVVLSRSTGGTAPRVLLSDSLQAPSLYKLRLFSVYSCQ